jgi:hypothetical protein
MLPARSRSGGVSVASGLTTAMSLGSAAVVFEALKKCSRSHLIPNGDAIPSVLLSLPSLWSLEGLVTKNNKHSKIKKMRVARFRWKSRLSDAIFHC